MTDKLLQSLSLADQSHVYVKESEDRVQITESPARFKLLIRHPKYVRWSGYVALPYESWHRIAKLIPLELYDYDGPGSDRIVWKDMAHGTMKDIDLFPLHRDTVWIGFGNPEVAGIRPSKELMQRLTVFENRIWSLRHAHSLD